MKIEWDNTLSLTSIMRKWSGCLSSKTGTTLDFAPQSLLNIGFHNISLRYDRNNMTVHMTEDELARDFHGAIEKVKQGIEVVIERDFDLLRFPIPTYSPKDGGPYITPGIVVSKDPETGIPDIGHYRFLILGKDTFSFSAQPNHRFGKHLAKYQQQMFQESENFLRIYDELMKRGQAAKFQRRIPNPYSGR